MSLFDFGISTAVNRQLSLLNMENSDHINKIKQYIFTFELIYWAIGFFLAALIFFFAPFSAVWINDASLPHAKLVESFYIMAVVIFFQWPITFYSGVYFGLDKHVALNVLKAIQAILQWGGVYGILMYFSNSLKSFLIWQLLTSVVIVIVMRFIIEIMLRKCEKDRQSYSFNPLLWQKGKAYFQGLTLMSLVAIVLSQVDFFLIPKLSSTPLATMGIYTVVFQLAGGMHYIGQPVYATIFPRLSVFSEQLEIKLLSDFYHRSSQILGVIVIPIAVTIAIFSTEILSIWSKNQELVDQLSELLSIMVIGTMLNVLALMPLGLQLSNKWTSLTTKFNLVLLLIHIPILYFFMPLYGLKVVTLSWLGLNFTYITIYSFLMHKRLLQGEFFYWFKSCFLIPFVISLIWIASLKYLIVNYTPNSVGIIAMTMIYLAAFLLCIFVLPQTRSIGLSMFTSFYSRFYRPQ